MIRELAEKDIDRIVQIHRQELPGFLSELGEGFLKKYYKVSLVIPEMFTFVEEKDGIIAGIVTGTTATRGLFKKIIVKDIAGFSGSLAVFFLANPQKIIKAVKVLSYPGFNEQAAELLTIAVSKKHQGRGVGKQLFGKIREEFGKQGIREFKISIYNKLSANRFYEKMGCIFERSFVFLEEKMNYYRYSI